MKTVNIAKLVGIALVGMLGLVALSFSGVLGSASKYVTFAEAKKMDESVHVVGKWVKQDQASYDSNQDIFSFYLQDSSNTISLVHYHDPQPENFATAEDIVIEGQYVGNIFDAERILMKCPSKYDKGEFTVEEATAKKS